MTRDEKIRYLLNNPDKLLLKRPFFRGSTSFSPIGGNDGTDRYTTQVQTVRLPRIQKTVVSQERFALELDPESHEVHFDANLPSICVKLKGKGQQGGYAEINFKRLGLPIQERIRQTQTLALCGNPIQFTLRDSKASETDTQNFADIKEAWTDRNQDGMIYKAVYNQLGYGDVGLLYYHNEKGEIKSRILSYEDGYVIISHNDDNGERLMECVYYEDADGVEHIDCYTDTYVYRLSNALDWASGVEKVRHNFGEIPLVTKRGNVGWNNVQSLIETYEMLYNIYTVIQKRHGWGILYIKGKLNESLKKIAGSIVLNDTSIDGTGSAEFKAPPTPQGVQDLLDDLFKQIQIGASCTFVLPEDIHSSGDVSGVAVQLTRQLDIEGAAQKVIDWQNFIDKCVRLFKRGLAMELVNSKKHPMAITEFEKLTIGSRFKIWRPFSEAEFNQMLATLKNAGILSKKTAIEKNTISQPDEEQRISTEEEEARKLQEAQQQQQLRNAITEANATGEGENNNNKQDED